MKKLLLFSFLFITLETQAQITVTQSTFPVAGTAWLTRSDNRYNMHTITAASGTAQTWNYANAFVIDDSNAVAFVPPASTPYASNFPNATLAAYDAPNDYATYFIGNTNGFYIDGFYDGMGTPPFQNVNPNPDLLIFPVPFTYNNTRNNNAKVEVIQSGTPALKIVLTVIQQFVCDAYGTLTTPVYSNQQVIRVKQTQFTVDTTYIDVLGNGNWTYVSSNPPSDSSVTFFFARNAAMPLLMEISAEPAAQTTSISASYYISVLSGINENSSNTGSVSVFPNPVASGVLKFNIDNPSASELFLYDLTGKQVYNTSVSGVNSLTVYTSDLAAGSYIYKVTSSDKSLIKTGMVMIAKD
ncbi:MAG: T9SS type A sorting domain-containing protein [Bacteroidia bacterium]|nr:T9SS type A sorting domain-containing protein [Bacteroidia bacterium]